MLSNQNNNLKLLNQLQLKQVHQLLSKPQLPSKPQLLSKPQFPPKPPSPLKPQLKRKNLKLPRYLIIIMNILKTEEAEAEAVEEAVEVLMETKVDLIILKVDEDEEGEEEIIKLEKDPFMFLKAINLTNLLRVLTVKGEEAEEVSVEVEDSAEAEVVVVVEAVEKVAMNNILMPKRNLPQLENLLKKPLLEQAPSKQNFPLMSEESSLMTIAQEVGVGDVVVVVATLRETVTNIHPLIPLLQFLKMSRVKDLKVDLSIVGDRKSVV